MLKCVCQVFSRTKYCSPIWPSASGLATALIAGPERPVDLDPAVVDPGGLLDLGQDLLAVELPDLPLEVGVVGVLVDQGLAQQVLQRRAEVGAHGCLAA